MQKFNYHTHTYRCGHATGTEEEMILAAIEAGFETIGISDHLCYEDWPAPNQRMAMDELPIYLETCYRLKEKYKDQIQVRVGFEIEYFDDCLDYLKRIQKQCDYLIIGQHSPFRGHFDYNDAPYFEDEWIEKMADQICAAVENGLVRYICHPDYYLLGGCDLSEGHKKALRRIAKCAKKHGAVVEVNVKGTGKGRQMYEGMECWRYPNYHIFEIFAEEECTVCFGYDAHSTLMLKNQAMEAQIRKEFEPLGLNFVETLDL